MSTVQLRRYRMEPGRLPAFLDWFPALIPTREQFGFRLLFAYADHENETFTWAVEHDGDAAAFAAAEESYHGSAERARVFESFPAGIAAMEIGLVEDVLRR
ncbi:hypothetical protein [Geodermatophilus sp. URMC 64]